VRERGGDLLDPAVAPLAASLPSLGSTPQKIRNAKSRAEVSAALNHYDGGSVAEYTEMVQSLDAAVGEVLTALRRSGQEEHTLGSTTGTPPARVTCTTWPRTRGSRPTAPDRPELPAELRAAWERTDRTLLPYPACAC
jgi:hypothetical protein